MRAIGFAVLMRRIEFRRELRLEATACLFELSFSPGHMSQQGLQLLWTQYQQCEHKYEQDFDAKTHGSPLSYTLFIGNDGCSADRLFFLSFQSGLEAADAVSDSFA